MSSSLDDIQKSVAALESEGRLRDALDMLMISDAAVSGDLGLVLKKGDISLRLLRPDIAAVSFKQALCISPENALIHYRLAMLYRDLHATESSLKHWLRVLDVSPNFSEAYFTAGLLYSLTGWFDLALEKFEHIRDCTDGFWLAEIERARGAYNDAQKQVEVLSKLEYGPTELSQLARYLLSIGELDGAKSVLQMLKGDSYVFAGLRFLVTWRELSLGSAIEQLAQFVKSDSSNQEICFVLADALSRSARWDEALRVLSSLDVTSAPPHRQELAYRIYYGAGPRWYSRALHLSRTMITQRPRDSKPSQYALTLFLSSGSINEIFGSSRTAKSPSAIPNTIFQFWHDKKMPADVLEVVNTWRSEETQLVLFNNEDARNFLGENFGSDYLAVYEACHHAAMKSDFIRLCYLYKHGGVYVDVDEECKGSPGTVLSSLRHADMLMPLSVGLPRYLNNNLIAATANHAIIKMALEEVVPVILRGRSRDIWSTTGPGLLTRSVVSYLSKDDMLKDTFAAMSHEYFRSLCVPRYALGYKSKPEGNWRMS